MNDEDLVSLYLTNPDRDIKDHQEVELLIEAYCHDLSDIIWEIRNMKVGGNIVEAVWAMDRMGKVGGWGGE